MLAWIAEIVVSRVREGIVKVMMAPFNCNECNSAEEGDFLAPWAASVVAASEAPLPT